MERIVQIISSRYITDRKILFDCLKELFSNNFEINECKDDEGWRVSVPRKVNKDEIAEIQVRCENALRLS